MPKTRHNSGASQYDCQADDRQDLCRDHHLYGDHGCKGTVEIDRPFDPRHRLFAEFHEYVFLRQIFQAACGDGGRWNTGTAKNKSTGPLDHFSFTHPVQPALQQAPTGEGSRPDCLHPRYPAFIQASSNRPPKVEGCPCLPLFRKGIDGKQTAASPSPNGRKRPMRPNPCAHCSQTAR